jgi:hypothetical protein
MATRAPNAQAVNKIAKTETLTRIRNAKDDIIAIINRRLQRANYMPVTPEGALNEARRLGYQVLVTATFSRESDNFVLDALVTREEDIAGFFGRGTSKNQTATVQIVRPQREIVNRGVVADGEMSLDDMYVEMSNRVRDLRRDVINMINEGRDEPLGDDAAIALADQLGYAITVEVWYSSGALQSSIDALTRSLRLMYLEYVYGHLGDTVASIDVNLVEPTEGERADQSFQEGISNCLLEPVIKLFKTKLDAAKTKDQRNRFSSKMNTAIDFEKKYRSTGVPESHIQKIADELGINIYIDAPIQGEFIRVSCTGRKYADMHFLNTRINHVDQVNEVTLKNTVFVTREFLDAKVLDLKRHSQYFEYQRHESVITYVRTLEGTFRVRGEHSDFVHEQERKYGFDEGKLCDVRDAELSEFIRSGVRFNTHVDFIDTSPYARITDEVITEGIRDYKEIDMEKAYRNYWRSRFYTGIVVKITDFRQTDKIEGEGYYLITDVVLVGKFKEIDAKLGYIYMDDCVYTKPELMFLLDQGCSFRVLAGAWGSSVDFRFEDEEWNEKEGNIKLYAKWVGKKAARYDRASHFISGPLKFLNHVASCVKDGTARILESGELYVSYDAERSDHFAHGAGYITAHTRIQVYDQLLAMETDKVIRVASDAIYYIDHEFERLGVFREQKELMKVNFAGAHYVGVDRYNGCANELAPARVYNKIEYHEGPGGSGKTHYNLHDKGLVRVLYVAPTHKLARAKYKETGCRCVVLARLCSPNPEKWSSLSKYYNVIVVDEVSMMSLNSQEIVLKRFPNHRILFCGDMCQLPHFDGSGIKSPGFDPSKATKIPHTKNYRIDEGDHLLTLLNKMRENIDVQGYAREIACEFKQMATKRLADNYKADDMILTYSNATKERLTEMIAARPEIQQKWIVTEKNAKYCNGDIIVGARPQATCQIRHAFTVHSVQGETVDNMLFVCPEVLVDNRLAYTAFSRARRYSQIYMLI